MVSETDRKAWKALEGKHDAVSNATRQELYDELAKTKMKLGQDPDGFMYIMETARDRLHDMGEHISPDRFGDLIINVLTPDYNFARVTSFRDLEFGPEDTKSTMRNTYADFLSRSSAHHRLQDAVSPCNCRTRCRHAILGSPQWCTMPHLKEVWTPQGGLP